MLIRQTKDTFIRHYSEFGYITNQLTKHDRVYNETGSDFLRQISREPKNIDTIITDLVKIYQDVSQKELAKDFREFVVDLEEDWFVVTGKSVSELNAKEPTFTYESENPKTAIYNFSTNDKLHIVNDSVTFFYNQFSKNPKILGLQIEVTSRCNERCIHCYIPNTKKMKEKILNFP